MPHATRRHLARAGDAEQIEAVDQPSMSELLPTEATKAEVGKYEYHLGMLINQTGFGTSIWDAGGRSKLAGLGIDMEWTPNAAREIQALDFGRPPAAR